MNILGIIATAFTHIRALAKKETPKIGQEILQGANAMKKIGLGINSISLLFLLSFGDMHKMTYDELLTNFEANPWFFAIILTVNIVAYVAYAYMKVAGTVQANEADTQ